MPIPMFAYLMASKSLAPSPTIPTLSTSSLSIRSSHLSYLRFLFISSLVRLMISALFSGDTLEYTFILGLRGRWLVIFRK
jgi:uncharacterized membrane protein